MPTTRLPKLENVLQNSTVLNLNLRSATKNYKFDQHCVFIELFCASLTPPIFHSSLFGSKQSFSNYLNLLKSASHVSCGMNSRIFADRHPVFPALNDFQSKQLWNNGGSKTLTRRSPYMIEVNAIPIDVTGWDGIRNK